MRHHLLRRNTLEELTAHRRVADSHLRCLRESVDRALNVERTDLHNLSAVPQLHQRADRDRRGKHTLLRRRDWIALRPTTLAFPRHRIFERFAKALQLFHLHAVPFKLTEATS